MSCSHCSSQEKLAVELETLRRQNDDLVKMCKLLVEKRLNVEVRMPDLPPGPMAERVARQVAAMAIVELDRVLEQRRQLYEQLNFYKFRYPLMAPPPRYEP